MKGRDAKPHIGIFGRRNNGKSSLINCLAAQDVAIVSSEPGTTTDPVKKSMEITGIGPVIMIDTAGTDDTGELGMKRVARTHEVIRNIDPGPGREPL
jgi:small GTP-binding protein